MSALIDFKFIYLRNLYTKFH